MKLAKIAVLGLSLVFAGSAVAGHKCHNKVYKKPAYGHCHKHCHAVKPACKRVKHYGYGYYHDNYYYAWEGPGWRSVGYYNPYYYNYYYGYPRDVYYVPGHYTRHRNHWHYVPGHYVNDGF